MHNAATSKVLFFDHSTISKEAVTSSDLSEKNLNTCKLLITQVLFYESEAWNPQKSDLTEMQCLQNRVCKWVTPWRDGRVRKTHKNEQYLNRCFGNWTVYSSANMLTFWRVNTASKFKRIHFCLEKIKVVFWKYFSECKYIVIFQLVKSCTEHFAIQAYSYFWALWAGERWAFRAYILQQGCSLLKYQFVRTF